MIDKVRKLCGIETWESPRDENPIQPGACSKTIMMVLLKDVKEVMLGSDENAYFRLLGDVEGVAPIHLSIGSEHPGQFWIADKDTPGGTYIDGVRCEPLKHYELKENNQLLLGGVQLNVSFVYRRV